MQDLSGRAVSVEISLMHQNTLPNSVTRRNFLATTATAAAAVTFTAAGMARAQDTPTKPGGKIRLGIIGCGKRFRNAHFRAMRSLKERAEIVALCDIQHSQLERAVKMVGGRVQQYRDYQQLLAKADIQGVIISTPGLFHKEMLLAALQAGKHAICEKPMGISYEEGVAMKRASDASDRIVVHGTQLRYSNYYRELRRQIEAGKVGRPTHLTLRLHRGDWAQEAWMYEDPRTGKRINWRMSKAASGGLLAEEACHYLDILNWMAGSMPESLHCKGGISCYTNDDRDTWDHAMVSLSYPGGCLGILDLCNYGPSNHEVQVVGDQGSLRALVDDRVLLFQTRGNRTKESLALPDEIGHGYHGPERGIETAVLNMYEDFFAGIRDGRKPWVDGEKAFNACKTAWLGDMSAELGRDVKWTELS